MNRVLGLDVSFYQNEPDTVQGINFQKMQEAGDFVIIRAGQNLWPDPDFKFNWQESKKAGIPRGSYWFYDSRVDPKTQAEIWFELMNKDLGELPLFADFEERFKGKYSGWRKWYDFLERMRSLVGDKEIGIYTAYYYWTDNAPNSITQASNLEYFHQYPLWVAHYGVEEPRIPKPWKKDEWLFWQFSEVGNGKAFGVESKSIDLNYFNGEESDFKERFPSPETVPVPEPEPQPVPLPSGEGNSQQRYYVNTASLRVRKGPGLLFDTIGYLSLGDVVEEISSTADRTWLQIRSETGLIGWCFSEYLQNIDKQPGTPPPSETIDFWYKTAVDELSVHAEPAFNSPIIGTLYRDDIVPILGDMTDDGWGQIQRVDGLTGWCKRISFTPISQAHPEIIYQRLSPGIIYVRKEITKPRKAVAHFVNIFLDKENCEFLVTPADSNGILCARTTSQFLGEFDMNIAINGDAYSYLSAARQLNNNPNACGDYVRPNGFAASRGAIYSRRRGPTLFIDRKNRMSMLPQGSVYNAISGNHVLVLGGKTRRDFPEERPAARSAIGISKDAGVIMFMVVDGNQPDMSEGLTTRELASLLVEVGAWSALSMDGGGSSTLVIKGFDGKPKVINSPIDKDIPGTERAVANHLGVQVTIKRDGLSFVPKLTLARKSN